MTPLQKVIKYIAITLAILITVSIVGGIVSILSVGSLFFDDIEVAGETKAYTFEGISTLDMEINAAELSVAVGDKFTVETNNKYVSVKERNGTLVISEKERFGVNYNGGAFLKITVPKNTVFDKADVITGAGTVDIEEFFVNKLEMVLGAGKAQINNLCVYKNAEIEGGAGAINISGGTLNNLDFAIGVGEVTLRSQLVGNTDIDCGIGKTEIILMGDKEDYKVDVEKGIGEAIVFGVNVQNKQVVGGGVNLISVDGGVGRIEVNAEE